MGDVTHISEAIEGLRMTSKLEFKIQGFKAEDRNAVVEVLIMSSVYPGMIKIKAGDGWSVDVPATHLIRVLRHLELANG